MNPAFSVIFLTTLIGAGQGLFLALYAAELGAFGSVAAGELRPFILVGSALSLALAGLGLFASFFHLGHPLRAWRSAAMWRRSWLSREVIVLPLFMAGVAAYGVAHGLGWSGTRPLGAVVVLACIALFVCTAMIYASIRFLQEWATPLTLVNYLLLGCASGFTLATALAALAAVDLLRPLAAAAALLTLAAFASRAASLVRNAQLAPRSTLQSATGIKHPRIRQTAQGFMGGSFNTREFFHGRAPGTLRALKWLFIALVFVLPLALLALGAAAASGALLAAAFAVQYAGLLIERWFFFAQANHPQNLYYQAIS
ncbi:sulfite dehydrogenase (quinone) subunit SoeC [Burkholderiaceae bacterium]|nr:sulfite dehydrogenase (quinone) subunit SoeC [Burkholderiaceae bacterium]